MYQCGEIRIDTINITISLAVRKTAFFPSAKFGIFTDDAEALKFVLIHIIPLQILGYTDRLNIFLIYFLFQYYLLSRYYFCRKSAFLRIKAKYCKKYKQYNTCLVDFMESHAILMSQ